MKRKILKILAVLIAVIIAVWATLLFILKDQFAVMNAIINKDRETISYYIDEKGFNPNDMYGDINLIHYYIVTNHGNIDTDFISFLIQNNINPNEGKMPPIISSILFSEYETLETLINSGADVNKFIKSKDNIFPLRVALQFNNCEMAKLLVDRGATFGDNYEDWIGKKLEQCKNNNWISVDKI